MGVTNVVARHTHCSLAETLSDNLSIRCFHCEEYIECFSSVLCLPNEREKEGDRGKHLFLQQMHFVTLSISQKPK